MPPAPAMISDPRSDAYYRAFKTQGGGTFPVFRGYGGQGGQGIGDIFRAIGRFILPAVVSAGKSFLGAFGEAREGGQDIKESLKAALKPAAAAALSSTVSQLTAPAAEQATAPAQSGQGRKRSKRRGATKKRGRSNALYKSSMMKLAKLFPAANSNF